jgi:predicted ABC-type transport system involved in lysophospholipase L1 biosynthesis ATPase subunit
VPSSPARASCSPTNRPAARTTPPASISDLLFELNAGSGTTLVLVTHDLRLAQRCQYIHRIDDGRLLPVERGAQA